MGKLEKLSREELDKARKDMEAQLKDIQRAQSEYDGRRLKELRGEIEAMVAKEGYTIDDVFGGKTGKRNSAGRSKGPAKYRHPENPEKTWSGRGRQPVWYKEAIAAGKAPEDMAI
ncbi:H-NS histone family protein [Jannaschia sp. LMIT008]|uniref:H-NS histone family protein n=1 Tax=Jannaschia maritima TaxID=3032585 RepID=UPI002811A717|nr:H-NS histone family protein [Jannaschia sp. LMIT008]